MNKLMLIGNITKDLEIKTSGGGNSYLRFTLAVNRKGKNLEKDTDFMPCVAFGRGAELIEEYCAKGSKLGVAGRLQIDSRQEDGQWKDSVSVIVEDFDFLSPKAEKTGNPFERAQAIDFKDDDLPF